MKEIETKTNETKKVKKPTKRTRSVSMQVMVTPEFRANLNEKIKASGVSRTAYIEGLVERDDGTSWTARENVLTELTAIGQELTAYRKDVNDVGKNFNQIVHLCNRLAEETAGTQTGMEAIAETFEKAQTAVELVRKTDARVIEIQREIYKTLKRLEGGN